MSGFVRRWNQLEKCWWFSDQSCWQLINQSNVFWHESVHILWTAGNVSPVQTVSDDYNVSVLQDPEGFNASSSRTEFSSWSVSVVFVPHRLSLSSSESPNMNSNSRVNDSMPSMATTAVGVSIFLLTTTACLVVKSRLYPCQSHRWDLHAGRRLFLLFYIS